MDAPLGGGVYTASLTPLGGAAAGAASGFASGGIIGGSVESAWQGAKGGALSGGLFTAANSISRDWEWYGKIAAKATAGGLSNGLQGRNFADGFRYNFLYSSAQEWTDYLASKSGLVAHDPETGKLRTDALRDNLPGSPRDASIFAGPDGSDSIWRMGAEGSGNHWYEGIAGIRNVVVDVSKVHDAMNSWMYSGGYFAATGNVFMDSFADVYSFVGMLPAAKFAVDGPNHGSAPWGHVY